MSAEWRIEGNRIVSARFYVDFNERLRSDPAVFLFHVAAHRGAVLHVGQRIPVTDFDEIESMAEVRTINPDGSCVVALIDFPPTTEPNAPPPDVQLIPEVKSLVEHSLAELAERPEWETIVRERLDAIHERSQREAWLLGQLVEARRQIDAAADRLRAIEERLTP